MNSVRTESEETKEEVDLRLCMYEEGWEDGKRCLSHSALVTACNPIESSLANNQRLGGQPHNLTTFPIE